MITHMGRNSGKKRFTVLDVIRLDRSCKKYVFYSGWGHNSDWAKNIRKNPHILLSISGKRLTGKMNQLSSNEARNELLQYSLSHPLAFKIVTKFLLPKNYQNEKLNDQLNSMSIKLPCYIFKSNIN